MASKKQIATVIMAIKTIYPYYAKDTDYSILADLWSSLLSSYDDVSVQASLKLCLEKCKNPPTPADIIGQIGVLQNVTSDGELWAKLVKELRQVDDLQQRFAYTYVEENGKSQGENARLQVQELFRKLPEELKTYIGSSGEMIRMSRNLSDETLKFERNQFLKTIPKIKKEQAARAEIAAKTADKLPCNQNIKKIEN